MMLVIHGRLECFSGGLLAIAKLIKGKRKEGGGRGLNRGLCYVPPDKFMCATSFKHGFEGLLSYFLLVGKASSLGLKGHGYLMCPIENLKYSVTNFFRYFLNGTL